MKEDEDVIVGNQEDIGDFAYDMDVEEEALDYSDQAHNNTKKEEEEGDEDSDKDEKACFDYEKEVHFSPALLSLWDEVVQDSGVVKASSSSSSSSRSSSSSSTQKSSSSSKSSQLKKRNHPGMPESQKCKDIKIAKREVQRSTAFGCHLLTPRTKGNDICGYQLTCRIPHHARCSKEIAVTVAGSSSNARRLLKAWGLMGHSVASRSEHMGPKVKASLLSALQTHTLLSEAELDSLMQSMDEGEAVAPFVPAQAATPSSESSQRTPSLLRQPLLGDVGDVPRGIHDQMIALCQQGTIPNTSLSQRLRNRPATDTAYEVPADFQVAVRLGYLGPNLRPPPGLIWRFKGGVWRLVPRGG